MIHEPIQYYGLILHRFFNCFQPVTYQGVPISKYIYYPFLYYVRRHWSLSRFQQTTDYWQSELERTPDTAIYQWADEPYSYDAHPDGQILMRGGFGDIAAQYLAKDRFTLLSPNQAEVDLIKANRPDLNSRNIETYYRENPAAIADLNRRIAQVLKEQAQHPVLGSADLLEWFEKKTPEIVRVLDASAWLIENLNIGAVLTVSSIVWMDSALNLVARAKRIPSLTIQHGLILDRDLFCHIPISATKKLVWGEATRDWYQKYGYPGSRLAVIGSPRFDAIHNQTWIGKQKLCQMLNIDPARKIVVYATGTDMNKIVPIVIDGLKPHANLFLLIALHPAETPLVAQYQKLTQDYPNCKVVRHGEIGLYNSLSGADFFITHCSTAGLEAMLFNLPVISIEPEPPPFSFGQAGASLVVTNAGQLCQTVRKLLTDESFRTKSIRQYQDFLKRHCIPDGSASKRLFQQLETVCRTGGTV